MGRKNGKSRKLRPANFRPKSGKHIIYQLKAHHLLRHSETHGIKRENRCKVLHFYGAIGPQVQHLERKMNQIFTPLLMRT
jgi:hypothetical protein